MGVRKERADCVERHVHRGTRCEACEQQHSEARVERQWVDGDGGTVQREEGEGDWGRENMFWEWA